MTNSTTACRTERAQLAQRIRRTPDGPDRAALVTEYNDLTRAENAARFTAVFGRPLQ